MYDLLLEIVFTPISSYTSTFKVYIVWADFNDGYDYECCLNCLTTIHLQCDRRHRNMFNTIMILCNK